MATDVVAARGDCRDASPSPSPGESSSGEPSLAPLPPAHPVRPYSEYNLFFRLERLRLIQTFGSVDEDLLSSFAPLDHVDPVEHPRPTKYANIRCPPYWYSITRSKTSEHIGHGGTKRRKHRKTSGKIDFKTQARMISANWKNLDLETRAYLRRIASFELERYEREVEDYCRRYGRDQFVKATNSSFRSKDKEKAKQKEKAKAMAKSAKTKAANAKAADMAYDEAKARNARALATRVERVERVEVETAKEDHQERLYRPGEAPENDRDEKEKTLQIFDALETRQQQSRSLGTSRSSSTTQQQYQQQQLLVQNRASALQHLTAQYPAYNMHAREQLLAHAEAQRNAQAEATNRALAVKLEYQQRCQQQIALAHSLAQTTPAHNPQPQRSSHHNPLTVHSTLHPPRSNHLLSQAGAQAQVTEAQALLHLRAVAQARSQANALAQAQASMLHLAPCSNSHTEPTRGGAYSHRSHGALTASNVGGGGVSRTSSTSSVLRPQDQRVYSHSQGARTASSVGSGIHGSGTSSAMNAGGTAVPTKNVPTLPDDLHQFQRDQMTALMTFQRRELEIQQRLIEEQRNRQFLEQQHIQKQKEQQEQQKKYMAAQQRQLQEQHMQLQVLLLRAKQENEGLNGSNNASNNARGTPGMGGCGRTLNNASPLRAASLIPERSNQGADGRISRTSSNASPMSIGSDDIDNSSGSRSHSCSVSSDGMSTSTNGSNEEKEYSHLREQQQQIKLKLKSIQESRQRKHSKQMQGAKKHEVPSQTTVERVTVERVPSSQYRSKQRQAPEQEGEVQNPQRTLQKEESNARNMREMQDIMTQHVMNRTAQSMQPPLSMQQLLLLQQNQMLPQLYNRPDVPVATEAPVAPAPTNSNFYQHNERNVDYQTAVAAIIKERQRIAQQQEPDEEDASDDGTGMEGSESDETLSKDGYESDNVGAGDKQPQDLHQFNGGAGNEKKDESIMSSHENTIDIEVISVKSATQFKNTPVSCRHCSQRVYVPSWTKAFECIDCGGSNMHMLQDETSRSVTS